MHGKRLQGLMFAAGLLTILGVGACRKPPPTAEADKTPTVTLQSARGKRQFDDTGRVIKQFDTNRDGNPDMWKIYRQVKGADGKTIDVLDRMELDINYDGKIDIWRFYNDKSELVREEMDLDFDGKIDVAIIYENGKVIRKELSQGFDEGVKVWKHYEDGKLVRVERITKTGGKLPDTFEIYQEGKIVAVGYDKDGDGKPDVWQKMKESSAGGAPAVQTGLGEEEMVMPTVGPSGKDGGAARPLAADGGAAPGPATAPGAATPPVPPVQKSTPPLNEKPVTDGGPPGAP
jgi:hypothetical protein